MENPPNPDHKRIQEAFDDPERLRRGLRRYGEEPELHDTEPRFTPTEAEIGRAATQDMVEAEFRRTLNPDQLRIELADPPEDGWKKRDGTSGVGWPD